MSGKLLSVINPYTEEAAFTLPMLSRGDLDRVVARAREAGRAWRETPVPQRVALCRKFADAFAAMRDSIAADITLQMGKPLRQSQNEVNGLLERTQGMTEIAEATLADEWLPEKPGFARYVRHEPVGVVLDIAAWNYPLLIAVNVIVPGVLAGNAVIVKHSSKTPRCAEAFAVAFERAGAPSGLVQAVVAGHAETEALVQHPGVDRVSFTGSVEGGRQINRSASERFIDVGLELGGKDPAYVCADADFNYAVDNCVDGVFYNAGQSCCAVERIYVERSIYAQFVEAFAAKTREYNVPGDPMQAATTLGPMASRTAPAFLAQQVEQAVRAGGRLVVRPDEFKVPRTGWFSAPAVVADAPQDSSLMQAESFGPVVGILPVDSDQEAIRLMNDSPYGLTASIWTRDQQRAIRIGERIETGTFYMNRCDYLDPHLPWCGVKDTGRGATLSRYGLLNLTRPKSMHLRTQIPAR